MTLPDSTTRARRTRAPPRRRTGPPGTTAATLRRNPMTEHPTNLRQPRNGRPDIPQRATIGDRTERRTA